VVPTLPSGHKIFFGLVSNAKSEGPNGYFSVLPLVHRHCLPAFNNHR